MIVTDLHNGSNSNQIDKLLENILMSLLNHINNVIKYKSLANKKQALFSISIEGNYFGRQKVYKSTENKAEITGWSNLDLTPSYPNKRQQQPHKHKI